MDNGEEVRVTNEQTGGAKGSKEARYDLIPVVPWNWVAKLYGRGARKYQDRNWEKGTAWSLMYAAAQRHMNAFWGGEDFDQETGVPHPICAVFEMLALVEYMQTHPELDDRAGSLLAKEVQSLTRLAAMTFQTRPPTPPGGAA